MRRARNDIFRIKYFAQFCRPYRLDLEAFSPHAISVSRPDGRSRYRRKAAREESPGSIDIRCRITSGGVFSAQAATTSGKVPQRTNRSAAPPSHPTLPRLRGREREGRSGVRVKRCGKSAPRFRQRKRQGKPHREQDRIGTAPRAVRESDNAARAMSGSSSGLVARGNVQTLSQRNGRHVPPRERRCPTEPGLQAG